MATHEQFVEEVVALGERAVARGGGAKSGKPVLPYLEGGLIPLGDGLSEGSFDPLFVRCVDLLVDGFALADVAELHEWATEQQATQACALARLQQRALRLLADGATPNVLRALLAPSVGVAEHVDQPVEARSTPAG